MPGLVAWDARRRYSLIYQHAESASHRRHHRCRDARREPGVCLGVRRPPADHGAGDRHAPRRAEAVLRALPRGNRHPGRRSGFVAQRRVGRRSQSLRGFRPAASSARIRLRDSRANTRRRSRSSGFAELKRIGMLPWREAEMFGHLRRGFDGFNRQAPYATSDVVLFAAVTSHYLQDAHQPFHATNNYDGQLTGNNGIHSRFERDLIERFSSRLHAHAGARQADPERARPRVRDARSRASRTSIAILKADSAAIAGKDVVRRRVLREILCRRSRPILEKQLSLAITATASVIVGAWESAGTACAEDRGRAPAAESQEIATGDRAWDGFRTSASSVAGSAGR